MENEKSFLERDNFEAELGFTSDDPFEVLNLNNP